MNDGYIFAIICWLMFIFFVTHWIDLFWKDSKQGIYFSRKIVICFLLMLLIGQTIYIPVSDHFYLNISTALLMVIPVYYFSKNSRSSFHIQMASVILFLGVFYAFSYQLFTLDPILMILPSHYLLACAFTLFINLTNQSLLQQMIMMLAGFSLGEWVHKCVVVLHMQPVYVGDGFFRDQLMVGFAFLIMGYHLVSYSSKGIRILFKRIRPEQHKEG